MLAITTSPAWSCGKFRVAWAQYPFNRCTGKNWQSLMSTVCMAAISGVMLWLWGRSSYQCTSARICCSWTAPESWTSWTKKPWKVPHRSGSSGLLVYSRTALGIHMAWYTDGSNTAPSTLHVTNTAPFSHRIMQQSYATVFYSVIRAKTDLRQSPSSLRVCLVYALVRQLIIKSDGFEDRCSF